MRISLRYLAIALLAGGACSRMDERLLNPPPSAPRARSQCLERKDVDYFFAPGQIDATRDDSYMRQSWFRGYLALAEAESLSCGEAKEAYRLTWMTSARDAKIFTVRRGTDGWKLEVVDFGKELFSPFNGRAHELKRVTKEITTTDLHRIRQELELLDFWSAKQFRWNPEMMDGYAMVIEGRSGDSYRAITRNNLWDGAEQVACPLFDIARIMLPDPIRCVRPVTVP